MKNRNIEKEICPYCGFAVRKNKLPRHMEIRCEKRPQPHQFADIFPRNSVPSWLSRLAETSELPTPIPLKNILENSCYYPASGLDASPVIILNGFIHSFVFVDYGIKYQDFREELAMGFRGYKRLLARDVKKNEIVPANWMPRMPEYFDEFNGFKRLMDAQRKCLPFGHWSIWKRTEKFDDRIGPPLFSFFFLGGEGLASFEGLYERNKIVPRAMAIIQPGHAFGNNWTNFLNPQASLWQTVVRANAIPDYLLTGFYGHSHQGNNNADCPFSGYSFLHKTVTAEPDHCKYIYNERGDTTFSLLFAIAESKKSGFEIRNKWVKGMYHTIKIWQKE